ncbi:5'-methylthioadenosine/S-adenosylhomocysteine nucleosidase [Paenibacillus selenitireducens]|uniref:adenosylhomocysteine nucleosidase n=1 Tax=Paenibacillus selenitireducens TaxID=1324314 RepID=A0A1T2X352_9BACL|nr:5'-methylthioadenosine/adenosylhomocysteine nucleosidase [Paenibacillus selenitireducens]OPA74245.1 5'-methylthioadenosine/S-adenosylhomocysteine nucleosidase [Paenibacillus selenitireducens]
MAIAIIGAMDEEVELLRSELQEIQETKVGRGVFYSGKLNNQEIVLLQSGIGKANAALTTALLIERFQPQLIINIGSAGALDSSLQIGDVVVASELAYSDVNATAFEYVYGQVPQMPARYPVDAHVYTLAQTLVNERNAEHNVVTGLITTEDSFIGTQAQADQIRSRFPESRATDMEGAAIAQTAYLLDIPFFAVRAISDNAGHGAGELFDANLHTAAKHSTEFVKQLISLDVIAE